MDNIRFTLPTVPASGMSRDDQGALIVNQAVAVIVAAYLDYKKSVASLEPSAARINHDDITNFINDWQAALKIF